MNDHIYYHSRHIPVEHLRLDQPMGQECYNNLLCHSLEEPYVDKLCDYGTGIRSYEALGKWQGRYETRLETGIITLDAQNLTIFFKEA